MYLLVTRPEPDGLKLIGMLEQRGHEAIAAPLSAFTAIPLDPSSLEGVSALIATSRNALRAMVGTEALELARGLPIFTVGAATAEEARRMGFARVVKGPGTAAALGPMIASMVDPAEDLLLHLAGDRLAYDLATELSESGIRVSSEIVYRMLAATALPHETVAAMRERDLDAVMLMSPEAARTWVRLVARHKLATEASEMLHLCLSEAVAGQLAPLGGVSVDVAERPTLEEMLALVDRAAAKLGE